MSFRRVPLANNPNAANSPYRANALKRTRTLTLDDDFQDQNGFPPKKKQQLDESHYGTRGLSAGLGEETDAKPGAGKPGGTQVSALQRKLAAARNTRQDGQQAPDKYGREKEAAERLERNDRERVKRWRKHYVGVFPSFTFYFESVPSDCSARASRQIAALGAREEKFFSKYITNVVTTRPIPTSAPEPTSKDDGDPSSKPAASTASQPQTRTINPSLLERSRELQPISSQVKGQHAIDKSSQRRSQASWQSLDTRRHQRNNNDTLLKARELGIKIWTWDKFERMVETIFNPEFDDERDEGTQPRQPRAMLAPSKVQKQKERKKEADLEQLLQNERHHGPAERATPWEDIIPFRGVFLYIHDMDERVKPVMVREYAKTANSEEAEWPMLHSVSRGRCPFVEEPLKREERELALARANAVKPKEKAGVEQTEPETAKHNMQQRNRTRSAIVTVGPPKEHPRTRSTTRSPQKPVLGNAQDAINRQVKPAMPAPLAKPSPAPPKLHTQTSSAMEAMPPMLGSTHASFRGISRNPGGEPLASGMRPSVTSAIQSQMISSAAAAPGARVGTSKQMHQLNRRVLERQSGLSNNSVSSSVNVNDVRAAINNERIPPPTRSVKQRTARAMARIHEDETLSEDEEGCCEKAKDGSEAEMTRPAKVEREPKPGYCENCREKYDDFDEHVHGKKHKKFAMDQENWVDLDDLLQQLVRR